MSVETARARVEALKAAASRNAQDVRAERKAARTAELEARTAANVIKRAEEAAQKVAQAIQKEQKKAKKFQKKNYELAVGKPENYIGVVRVFQGFDVDVVAVDEVMHTFKIQKADIPDLIQTLEEIISTNTEKKD